MATENRFMKEAIELSVANVRNGGGPFAAVVVRNGAVIGRGVNRVTVTNDPTAHAEVVAIREACRSINSFQLEGCEFYTTCEPCPMCLGAIYWARPAKVYYANTREDAAKIGFDDSLIYEEISRSFADRKIPSEQLMRDQAQAAFLEWERKADKIRY